MKYMSFLKEAPSQADLKPKQRLNSLSLSENQVLDRAARECTRENIERFCFSRALGSRGEAA